ncbi:MAG: M15 family peptidase [Alphaproteobacteria bacterium]
MNVSAIRLLQTRLAELGHYHDDIDGQRGPNTHAAVIAALAPRSGDMPPGWRDWSDKRKSIGFLQLWCHDEGIDAGNIDGRWGPQTRFAVDALGEQIDTGNPPLNWRDIVPGSANPHGWPADGPGQQALSAFYGPHGEKNGFTPPMRTVTCPWRLRLSWNLAQGTRRIGCHEKAADSLSRVLTEVFRHYGEADVARLRLDVYGGCYNPRKKRGGSTWSTHAWGVALDFDPDNNQLRWGRDKASFAHPDCDAWWNIWEDEGWVSLGRVKNFDWMHVQAVKSGS